MTEPSRGLTVLDGDQEVVTTREEHHQEAILRWAPGPDGRPRRVVAELVPSTIDHGTHRGRPGIEVRLDGRRVGELTHLMAQRYGPLVAAHLRAGRRPAVAATVRRDHRGLQVDLLLPRPDAVIGPAAPAGPGPRATPAAVRQGAPALPTLALGPTVTDRRGPAGPPLPARPGQPAGGRPPAGPPTADGVRPPAGPPTAAGVRPPGGPTPPAGPSGRRRRRTPWLVGAGVVALLVVVAAAIGGGRDTATTAAGVVVPAPAAPTSTSPTPSPGPTATADAPPAVVVAGAAVPAPRTTSPRPAPPARTSPAAPTPAPQPAPRPVPRPVPKPVPQPAPKPVSKCDPNYSGACVPIASDVDCAGGSGNGPAYVQGPVTVIGKDIYGLDGNDNDGIGCE